MKINVNYLYKLKYKEISLKDIEIEITPAVEPTEGDDVTELSCGLGLKGEKPLTENALKQLCAYLKIPYPFTKRLRSQGKLHVLSYIQRQLSQAEHASVVLVSNDSVILSVTEDDMLHYRGKDAVTLDNKLQGILGAVDSPLELLEVINEKGSFHYFMVDRKVNDEVASKWGFVFSHSALGEFVPSIHVFIHSLSDASRVLLPAKLYSYPIDFEMEFENKWNQIASFIKSPPETHWLFYSSMLSKLQGTVASYREVKDARRVLNKLKIDKEDTEFSQRIDKALQWKRIKEEYNIKDLPEPPNKLWYTRASTPITCLSLVQLLMKEGTYATVPYDLREAVLSHAGKLVSGTLDLSKVQTPPVIDWD